MGVRIIKFFDFLGKIVLEFKYIAPQSRVPRYTLQKNANREREE